MTIKKIYRQPSKRTSKPCPSCKRLVLAGLDARAAALSVVIDAEVLTREGELLMIVAGVNVYATNTQGDIVRRNASEVLRHAEHLKMHREHDCEQLTPAHLIAPPPIKPSKPPHTEGLPF
jgi:hypothetical protein